MKVNDLDPVQPVQLSNANMLLSAGIQRRTRLFSFFSLCQIDSQKIRFLSLLASIYSLFQSIFISFWPHLDFTNKPITNKFEYIRTPAPYEENLTNAFFIYSTEKDPEHLYMVSLIIFFISFIFFLLSVYSFCSYYFKKIINFQLILCFNFFVQFICQIIIIPIGFQVGWLISKVSYIKDLEKNKKGTDELGSTSIYLAIIVLNAFLFLIMILVSILSNFFNANSILVVEPHFGFFNGVFRCFHKLVPPVILLFSNIFPLINRKSCYLIISLHMCYCICSVIWIFWLPYGKKFSNILISSVSLSMLLSDIVCLTKLNTNWYRYLIFLGGFVFFFILMNIFINLRIKFILKKAQIEENENEGDKNEPSNFNDILSANKMKTVKFQAFGDPTNWPESLEKKSVSKLLFILRVSMMTKSRIFTDGKIIELISSKIDKDQDKINFCRIICYFPDFQPIFFSILTSLKRAQFLSFDLEFRLFQLRCYDSCCSPDAKVFELEEVINETKFLSLCIRSLWLNIDQKCTDYEKTSSLNSSSDNDSNQNRKLEMKTSFFSSFDRLSQSIFNCDNKWKSVINFYPNNIFVSEEYSKFLIDCCGNFISASEWKTISISLHEGKTFRFNPAIVSFLRAYPRYSKVIIPKKSMLKSVDDIDFRNKIENIGNMIEMPETRFEYQRSAKSSYPISIYIFLVIAILSLCFILCFWIYAMCSYGTFEHIYESLYFIVNTAFLAQQISKNLIVGIMDFGQLPLYGLAPTQKEIFDAIYENGENDRVDKKSVKSLVQLNGKYSSQLAAITERGMGLIDYLHNSTLEQIEKGNKFQVVLDVFYNNSLPSTHYLSKDKEIETSSNLQSLMISFFTYYFKMSYDKNHSYVNDTEFYYATMAGTMSIDQVDLISQSILENNQILLDEADSTYSTDIYLISIFYILLSCVFVWIDFIFIIKNFSNICNSLCYFPKAVRMKACESMIKEENSSEGEVEIKMQPKFKNVLIVSLVVATLINLILGFGIFSFHFVYEKYKNEFLAISHQVHYYSLKTAEVIEVLYSVMGAAVFGQIVPHVDKKYKDRVLVSLNRFILTHEACGNLSYEKDCGISQEYIDIMNNLKNLEKCPDMEGKTFHETIACLSEESMVNAFIDLTQTLERNTNNPQLLHTVTFKQYIHFALSHVYYEVRNFGNYLVLGAGEEQIEYKKLIHLYGALSIGVSLLLFLLNIYIFIKFRRIHKLLIAFISRVLPSDFVLNSNLLMSLLGIKNANKQVIDDEETSFLVQESSSPIVFIDRSALIEFVNNAFTSSFHYEANFIVGQPISILFEDESALFVVDTMKFFSSHDVISKTVKCIKGNGNKTDYEITFIPIHSKSTDLKNENFDFDDSELKNTFINRIALVFVDKTSETNLEKKCNSMKVLNQNIESSVFPQSLRLYMNGRLKMCSICLIKISNNYRANEKPKMILAQRANVYNLLYEKLKIYPLLIPFDVRNGVFAAVGCNKDDPVELAIECLNFVFNTIDELAGILTINLPSKNYGINANQPFFAVVETGGELIVNWSGDETKKTWITGELIERAMQVLDNAKLAGPICVSKKTYEHLMQHDYAFTEREVPEKICGCNYIYAVENNIPEESFPENEKE